MAKKKSSNKANKQERGNVPPVEAEQIVEESEQASTEADVEGGDDAYEATDEEPSAEVADARAEAHAEQSPASVQPTVHNDNMADDPTEPLTPGQKENLAEDDPRNDDDEDDDAQDAEAALPFATPAERASTLAINEEATEAVDVKKAAKAVSVDPDMVIGHAVRGNALTGQYLVVVTGDGKKHTVKYDKG